MENLASLVVIVFAVLIALPFARAWAWCLADLRDHATDLDSPSRGQWLAALLLVSVFAIPAYVTVGPGRGRWDARTLWWPWKRP